MADMKFVVDYSDIQTMRRELVGVSKDAKQSASVFETAYRKAERQLEQTAKANQNFYNATLGVNKVSKDASKSASVFTQELRKQEKATEAYAKETRRLQLEYNKTFRAADSFKRQLGELNQAHVRGAISTDRHEQQVMQLKNEYREFLRTGGGAMNQFGQIASKGTRQFKRFGAVGMQQVGYQVGDFAVQLQGGTNAAVALGQQGSQLLGIFGPMGAVMGAVLAIVTAFAAPMLDLSAAAKEAADEFEDFDNKLKSARDTVKSMTTDLEILQKGFAGVFEKTLVDQITLAENKLKDAQKEYRELIRLAEEQIAASSLSGSSITPEDIVGTSRLEAAREAIRLAEEELRVAREVNREKELRDASDRARKSLDEARKEAWKRTEENIRAAAAALFAFKEDADATARTLDSVFKSRTLFYNIRFSGEETVMNQPVKAAGGKLNPGKSYEELLAMGVSPDALRAMGMEIPDKFKPKMRPMDLGAPKPSTSSGGGGSAKAQETSMERLIRQVQLNEELLGLSQARQQVLRALGDEASNYNQKQIDAVVQRIQAYDMEKQALEDARQQMQTMADTLESSMSNAFMTMVEGTVSFKDAMREMARAVIKQLFDILVVQRLVGSFDAQTSKGSGIVGSIMGLFANGAAFSGGRVTAFADGGVVSKPTMFPMANGAGLMGEAGPEAVMPLKRGKGGKLGVAAEGGSSGPVTVNNHFHIAANGDESVKRIIQQEAPKISAMTEKQIINSRRRGGSLKQAFG